MIKISRPIQKGIYPRQRLFEKLDRMRDLPVIWISAPAGSGKTTLVSSFIENRKIPCLWYQLDKSDEDLPTFFYYLGEAITKAAPGKHKPMPLLTPEYHQGVPTFTMRYFEELHRRLKAPSWLVFDNYQEVSAESPFHEMIVNAISRIPAGVNMVAISRSDSPSPFIRLKANSHMEVLRWDDVRLSEEEAREIICGRVKAPIAPDAIQHLYNLSDGWAAGLVLILEAMKRLKIEPGDIEKHAHDEIFSYFSQEVFNRLDRHLQEFFMKTAFLPQMTVSMAEELTGELQSGQILQSMNRNNSFVTKRIHSEAFYEYHPLFRNFLFAQSESMFSPEALAGMKRSAALILENAGQAGAAVLLLKDLGDWKAMAAVIVAQAPDLLKQGRHRLLGDWLDTLPFHVLDGNPWLLYCKGMSILPFEPQSAKPGFEKAFGGFQTAKDNLGAILAASAVVQAIAHSFDDFSLLDHWYDLLNDLTAHVERYPNAEIEASVIAGMIMASELGLGTSRRPEAENWAKRALGIAELPETIVFKVQALHFLLWHRLVHKSAYEALPLLRHMELLSRSPPAQPLSSIAFRSAQVQYCLFAGLHQELMEAVNKGLEISRETGVHMEDMWFHLHAIASFLNRRDLNGAAAWFERMSPMVEQLPGWARFLYHNQLARMSLVRKDHHQAFHEAKRALDFSNQCATAGLFHADALLMLAQVSHQMGKREEALEYLAQGHGHLLQADCRSHFALTLLLEAAFAFEGGDRDQGLQLLRRSFAMAREGGYVLGVSDDPNLTLKMCEKALEEGIETEYVRTIIRRRGLIPDKPPIHVEAWPWKVKILTLGSFVLIRDDEPAEFSRKLQQKPLAMLKALIALGGQGIQEERLTDLLWPDADGDMAHQSFDTTLHRLRKLLGRPEALILRDGKVTLDNRYCWVDIWAFESLFGQAEELRKKGETEHAGGLTEKAIALYRGDFLAGEREEPWMVAPSERLKSIFFKSVSWLGHCLEGAGRWEQAADHYERFLERDLCREDFYRRLMVCYDQLGRKSEAASVYQRCRRSLFSILGTSPSAETEAARASIFSKKIS